MVEVAGEPAVGGAEVGPVVEGIVAATATPAVLGEFFNPLIEGIKLSYGEILGLTTKLPDTAEPETEGAERYPSGNILKENSYLFIPKIGLEAPVYLSQTIAGDYLVGHKQVLLAEDENDTVFYGHYTGDVFGGLSKLSYGDSIFYTDSGVLKTYQVKTIARVSESYTKVLNQDNPDIITLITCDKFDPNLRVVITAEIFQI